MEKKFDPFLNLDLSSSVIINGPNVMANHHKISTMSFGKLQFILYNYILYNCFILRTPPWNFLFSSSQSAFCM